MSAGKESWIDTHIGCILTMVIIVVFAIITFSVLNNQLAECQDSVGWISKFGFSSDNVETCVNTGQGFACFLKGSSLPSGLRCELDYNQQPAEEDFIEFGDLVVSQRIAVDGYIIFDSEPFSKPSSDLRGCPEGSFCHRHGRFLIVGDVSQQPALQRECVKRYHGLTGLDYCLCWSDEPCVSGVCVEWTWLGPASGSYCSCWKGELCAVEEEEQRECVKYLPIFNCNERLLHGVVCCYHTNIFGGEILALLSSNPNLSDDVFYTFYDSCDGIVVDCVSACSSNQPCLCWSDEPCAGDLK